MRLLVVSDIYPPVDGGRDETECRDVVEHLRDRHDVTVLTSELQAGTVPSDPSILRTLPWTGSLTRGDGVRAPLTAARGVAVMRETLRCVAPDAVLLYRGAAIPAAALRALQESGVPVLVRVCECWMGRVYGADQYTKWLVGAQFSRARRAWSAALRSLNRLPALRTETTRSLPVAVAWCSEFVRDQSQPLTGFRVAHEEVVFSASARAETLAAMTREPQPNRILFVGRLERRKGPQVLVRALAVLRDRGVDATLHIAGTGSDPEAAALIELAQRFGLGGQVHLVGQLDGDALLDEVSRAAVWSIPSIWQEPSGIVALEAATARVPAVISRVGGMPEVLVPDVHALYHEAGDVEGCADALGRALGGGPDVQERVDRAYARAREHDFASLLTRLDRFLDDGLAALAAS